MIGGGIGGAGSAGATPLAGTEELIQNGGFDPDIHVPWWWDSGTEFTREIVAGELCVEIAALPDGRKRDEVNPSVGQSGTHIPIIAGDKYAFSFDVAAAAPQKISASVINEGADGEPYLFDAEIWPGTGMQRYKFTFFAPWSTDRGGVAFRLGGMAGAHTVFLDNVSLIHYTPA